MKPISYYTNVGARPTQNDFTVVHVYKNGEKLDTVHHSEFAASKFPAGSVLERVTDAEAYALAKKAYNDKAGVLMQEFKADALAGAGLTGHPKAERAFALAMEIEDNNLGAAADRLVDLAELID
jgi:hypothetical protein